MKKLIVPLSMLVVTTALLALMLSVASATLLPSQQVVFEKEANAETVHSGEIFTFTLTFANASSESLEVRVSDPNPDPEYLEILADTITGGAFYSPALDGVVWEGTLGVGSLPHQVTFQMSVADVVPASGKLITNTATMVDQAEPGSLPDALAEASIRIMPKFRLFMPVVFKSAQ